MLVPEGSCSSGSSLSSFSGTFEHISRVRFSPSQRGGGGAITSKKDRGPPRTFNGVSLKKSTVGTLAEPFIERRYLTINFTSRDIRRNRLYLGECS